MTTRSIRHTPTAYLSFDVTSIFLFSPPPCHHRFQTLLHYFKNYDVFNIDFMVACMQFINIVVHSVEDMNFRVHLQYEFTKIGLDDYLHKLKNTESERLLVQVSWSGFFISDIGIAIWPRLTANQIQRKKVR